MGLQLLFQAIYNLMRNTLVTENLSIFLASIVFAFLSTKNNTNVYNHCWCLYLSFLCAKWLTCPLTHLALYCYPQGSTPLGWRIAAGRFGMRHPGASVLNKEDQKHGQKSWQPHVWHGRKVHSTQSPRRDDWSFSSREPPIISSVLGWLTPGVIDCCCLQGSSEHSHFWLREGGKQLAVQRWKQFIRLELSFGIRDKYS